MVGQIHSMNLATQPKIVFGAGSIQQIGKLAKNTGEKVLLVTGGRSWEESTTKDLVEKLLSAAGLSWEQYPITGEPSPDIVDQAVEQYKSFKPDQVIAIGGGSVLDAGKAIAAMFCEDGSVKNYLEGVGDQLPSGKRLGLIAIPTTSGTGSEATKNAVISELGKNGFKKSLRHEKYVPDLALVDPALTLSCSVKQSCASGMDAFTQLLESYISTAANDYTDALALSGLKAISRSLPELHIHTDKLEARTDMSYAAMLSGITLANAGLGIVHGFAQPLGSLFPVPHGIVCAGLMGAVNRVSLQKISKDPTQDLTLKKYASIGRLFLTDGGLTDTHYASLLIEKIDQMTEVFEIPKFSVFGVSLQDIPEIIAQTGHKNHPVKLAEEELSQILKERI